MPRFRLRCPPWAVTSLAMRKTIILAAMALLLTGCSQHVVDTFPEWCEKISGVDLEEKYAPFWAVVFSVKFDGDAIRDDFVKFLDDMHMQKAERRTPRMVWREGTELHLVNLSSLLVIEPEKIIAEWRRGIETVKSGASADDAEWCLYGTVTSMFDGLHIHSMESDVFGQNWTDDVTVIPTERKERLGDKAL